jgi:hypothetical protein
MSISPTSSQYVYAALASGAGAIVGTGTNLKTFDESFHTTRQGRPLSDRPAADSRKGELAGECHPD